MLYCKERRTLDMNDLRQLCIKNNWYTLGTNEQYSKLLDMTRVDNVTSEMIAKMAYDIKFKSETEHNAESICFEIARICYSFFELDEKEG